MPNHVHLIAVPETESSLARGNFQGRSCFSALVFLN
jgi:hypothetical protein